MSGHTLSLGAIALDMPDLSLEEIFRTTAEWGLKHVDLYYKVNYVDFDVDEVRRLSRVYDVQVHSISTRGIPLSQRLDVTEQLEVISQALEHAGQLGAGFSESMAGPTKLSTAEAVDRYVELISPIVRRAETLGVTLLVENVFNRDEARDPTASVEGTRMLLERVGSDNFALCWDIANFAVNGESTHPHPYEALKPWIKYVHLKDTLPQASCTLPYQETKRIMVDPERGGFVSVPLGQGIVDVDGVVDRLIRDEFAYPVTVELFCSPDKRAPYWDQTGQWLKSKGLLA
ncbi:sugar phosphate isomerase/epimerase [Microvirga sp. VF16]|uniref:sugar phosphate isomerase/epimerase family protein n=1 Tax=Microvirga sp. VF16 TaxID=2807101 RepID=UPI00193E3898|nr:sugar phosphate isomerase/epimerase family protein [Microvirga sp. VF16]QRM33164.1 sugar phosphate isomerase/epimerase [Microvirga sp. VF16]